MSFEHYTPIIKKWKLDIFMNVVDRFDDDLAEKTHHKITVGIDYQTILLHIAGKSILIMREILTLCAHGYPDGALSLGRNLYEQMMIAAFFEIHKEDLDFHEYVENFFLSSEVQRYKCLRYIEKYIPDEENSNLLSEYDVLKNRTNCKLKGDYWWARCKSFSDLISCIMNEQIDEKMKQFLGIHYVRYKRACISLHASCMGNSNRIGNYSGFKVIDTSPTVYGHSTPLLFAVVSLITIFGWVCKAFEIHDSKYLNTLNKLALFYQSEEKYDTKKNDDGEI